MYTYVTERPLTTGYWKYNPSLNTAVYYKSPDDEDKGIYHYCA